MSLPEFFFDRVTTELRQQMEDVRALAEQLARLPLPAEAAACAAGIADGSAGALLTLQQGIDLRALAEGRLNLKTEPVGLRALMDDVQARWQARTAQAGITLLVSYDGPPEACAMSDRSRLAQVFDGFIGEALAGARGNAVEVSLRATAAAGRLLMQGRVRGPDLPAGAGMEERVREVEAQFGLRDALGVMLARRILQSLAGAPPSDAEAMAGDPTSFTLSLPCAVEAAARPSIVPHDPRPAHILVVDDNATNRVVAQALCEMAGCTSEAAEDGLQAVEAARSGRFDVILMDIRMPNLDGVDATRAIRALPGKAGATPIVALTANVDGEDYAHYRAAGMCGVLEKPIKAEMLRTALGKALSQVAKAAAA